MHPNTSPDLEALAHKVVHYSAPCLPSSTSHKNLYICVCQHMSMIYASSHQPKCSMVEGSGRLAVPQYTLSPAAQAVPCQRRPKTALERRTARRSTPCNGIEIAPQCRLLRTRAHCLCCVQRQTCRGRVFF